MKKLLFLIFTVLAITSNAQNVWAPDSVIQCPGKSVNEIISCATNWALLHFAEDSPSITTNDNVITIELQKIPFEIKNLTWQAGSGYLTGFVNIEAKEGRFKIRLLNFNHFSSNRQYNDWWTMGLIADGIPEKYQKGAKWKQKREVYKRVLEFLNNLKEDSFKSAAEFVQNCNADEEEDW